jgi:3-deoxy-D-manno-octulosonate 8-phosphate phosphatase (KDO 8-P phosphatase)
MSNYKDKLHQITTFIFDYDGVITDGTVYPTSDGDLMRTANVKDGYAMQLAVKKGYRMAIISGGKSESMIQRMKSSQNRGCFFGCKQQN